MSVSLQVSLLAFCFVLNEARTEFYYLIYIYTFLNVQYRLDIFILSIFFNFVRIVIIFPSYFFHFFLCLLYFFLKLFFNFFYFFHFPCSYFYVSKTQKLFCFSSNLHRQVKKTPNLIVRLLSFYPNRILYLYGTA